MAMSTEEAKQQLLFQPNLQHNIASLATVKFLCSAFTGSVAGVLGLENYWGFALFVFSTLFSSGAFWVVRCEARDVKKYFQGGWWEIINPGQDNIFSFILFWTLFYGIVHIYD